MHTLQRQSGVVPVPGSFGYAITTHQGRILKISDDLSLWLGRSQQDLCSGVYLHTLCDEASGPLFHAQYAWLQVQAARAIEPVHQPATGCIRLRGAAGQLICLRFACAPYQLNRLGAQAGSATNTLEPEDEEASCSPAARFFFLPQDATDALMTACADAPVAGPFAATQETEAPAFTAPALSADTAWTPDQLHVRHLLATHATSEGIWDWDQESGLVFYSARWQSILGLEEEDKTAGAEHLLERLHPRDRDRFLAFFYEPEDTGGTPLEGEFRMLHADGVWRWYLVRGICMRPAARSAAAAPVRARIIGTFSDVTRHRVLDALTGLYNRFSLLERLERLLETGSSNELPFAVLFIDLDRFKRINDSFSHGHGDSVLKEVGRRIASTLSSDSRSFAARLGGDEFVVVVDGMEELDVAMYTHALQTLLQVPVRCGDQQLSLTASVGVAMSTIGYKQPEDMLQDADMAMYRAKDAGKARACFFTTCMREKNRERMHIEVELRRAIPGNELVLHYQPKVRLKTAEVTGFEALVRWNHPVQGLVGPGRFIPIAEDTDLILSIGRWTMIEAIRQAAVWRAQGILPPEARIGVNLSARQFIDRGLVALVSSALAAEKLPARCLAIEVTESALIDDMDSALATLKELKALGVSLELDDFGMGYSSLSYLHRFPFDVLKVDRSFVVSLGETDESSAIARSVIALGSALKMKVLAEGIETADQARRLLALGCQYGQGYYYAKPMTPTDAVFFLAEQAQKRKSLTVRKPAVLAHVTHPSLAIAAQTRTPISVGGLLS